MRFFCKLPRAYAREVFGSVTLFYVCKIFDITLRPLYGGKIKSQHRKSAFKHKSDGVFYNLYMGGKLSYHALFADLVLPGLKLGLYKANRLSPVPKKGS